MTAYAFAVTMLGTTLPTPLYPTYEQRFAFGTLTVTVVFATYAVGVLAALVGFGRASDSTGRKPWLLGGLAAAVVSSVIFIGASHAHTGGLTLLLVGRFVSGLSAGIFTGTATATLADYGGERKQWASLVAAVANIGGLGIGPLIAGALARDVAEPLLTPYALHVVLAVGAAAIVALIPESVAVDSPRRFRMQRLGIPAAIRATFVQAGIAGFAGFAVLGFFTAVSPATLGLLGYHDPVVTGAVVFAVFASSAAGQVFSVRVSTTVSLLGGTATLVVGIALIGVAIGVTSLTLLVVGGVVTGVGQGLSFRSALGEVTGASPPDQRGAVSSSFFAVCYVGLSLPVIGVGAGSDAFGLPHTGETFAGVMAGLALVAVALLSRSRARAR
ncbi:MAG TPA: MFS transporter [Mycobacteriales bacterium]|nr:MFS transporter [Mycobacteriales bacterium]